jgi:hypothetical protein
MPRRRAHLVKLDGKHIGAGDEQRRADEQPPHRGHLERPLRRRLAREHSHVLWHVVSSNCSDAEPLLVKEAGTTEGRRDVTRALDAPSTPFR